MTEGVGNGEASTIDGIGARLDEIQENVSAVTSQAARQHEALQVVPGQINEALEQLEHIQQIIAALGTTCFGNINTHIDLSRKADNAQQLAARTLGTSNQEPAIGVMQALYQLAEGQELLTGSVAVDAPSNHLLRSIAYNLQEAARSLGTLRGQSLRQLLTLTDKVQVAGQVADEAITAYQNHL